MSQGVSYSAAITELLAMRPVTDLGPGQPIPSVRARLEALTDADFGEAVGDRAMLAACRAGLWLAFNYLDESHAISQNLDTAEGSFWHAIMHRREPDASNSKYWWRKVGPHPVLDQLTAQAPALGYSYSTPQAFVDWCESVRGRGTPDEECAKRVQHLEWRLLFDHCWQRGVAR